MRWDTNNDGIPDRYSHYRHLTNLSRPGNGWRVCRDISDVTAWLNADGGIVQDLSIPIEQWLPTRPQGLSTFFDDAILNNSVDFALWTRDLSGYAISYNTQSLIPNNYYRLSDLSGDGETHEPGERPQDEFNGLGHPDFPNGAARWQIGRYLAVKPL